MTVRRVLLNFGSFCTDFRIGPDALAELPALAPSAVAKPKRAVIVTEAGLAEHPGVTVSRSLVDAGFRVDDLSLPDGEDLATLSYAHELFDALARCAITADDLIVGLGGAEVLSLVTFCAQAWCGGTACLLIPTTLDAMVSSSTEMQPLATEGGAALVSLQPRVAMTVCDLSFAVAAPVAANGLGYLQMLSAALSDSRRGWNRFGEEIPGLVEAQDLAFMDAVSAAQQARVDTLTSPSPSVRTSFSFGMTTARALRACLGASIPWYQLVAEGMRFEARLAVDANDFSRDDLFELDDRIDDLGIDELAFSLDRTRFVAALKETRLKRANRFLFSLPRHPGTIRLTVVADELLDAHAAAYLASRAALQDADANA